jgi:nucleoside 2-deoxyribosyltransferase
MKIYLAGPLSWAWRLHPVARRLTAAGHVITSRWLYQRPSSGARLRLAAAQDLADIDAADVVIHFTQAGKYVGGARHVEAGYALGTGKRLVICGPRENLFYHLPHVDQVSTWPDLLQLLASYS